MKKLISGFIALCCILPFARFAFAESGLVQIFDHVYSYVDAKDGSPANSYGANAGIIIGKDAILVVDTLVSAKEGKRLIKDIRAITDKPIKYVANTHYHLDHTFGNAEFASLGADIISHASCAAAMQKSATDTLANADAYGLSAEDMAGTRPAYPNVTFTDRMALDLGGIKAEMIYISPSHSNGSIVIYLPAERVVFAGDILFTDFHPYMADGNLDGWIKALESLAVLDADFIIPGHGPVSTNKDLEEMKSYIVSFDKKAKELAAESSDAAFIAAELKKSMPARTRGEGLIQANVQGKYLK